MRPAPKIALAVGALTVLVVAVGVNLVGSRSSRSKLTEPAATQEPAPSGSPPAAAVTAAPHSPTVDAAPLPLPPAPVTAPKPASARPTSLSEAELLDRLRKAQDTDQYLLSYDLAREGLRRFPKSADAPEMAAMVVKSLARQGKISEARAEAEVMVNKYAGTKWALEVERHTGAHPTRNQVPPPSPPAERD